MTERSVLGGRYELGDALGRGGMAEVRRGDDLRLGRPVAVKLLSRELAADPVARTRFSREAQSAASLNHPSIVAVFDTGEEVDATTGGTLPYIVMELVEGKTLRAVLTGGHALPPQRALEVTQAVLAALAHSHEAGIIHRDIKPANVMLTPSGATKVMDFGIARAVTDTSTDLTQTAAVMGTAQYLSPEQARGERVDARTDLYSTGCLLYELLVGRPPFVGETAISLVYQHVREDPVPPSQHNPLIHPQVDAIVLKALAKDPDDRYQSARAMSDDITRALSGELTEAATAEAGADEPTAVAAASPVATTAVLGAVPPAGPLADAVPPATSTSSAGDDQPPVPPPSPAVTSDPRPTRRTGRWLLVAAVVLLLLAVGGYAVLRPDPGPAAAAGVDVPNVVGDSRAKAEDALRQAHLTPKVKVVKGADDDTVDTVVQQDPLSGRQVPADTTVTLTVNSRTTTGKIPDDLVGRDLETARKSLDEAGFTNVKTKEDDDPPSSADADEVTSVDPKEGKSVGLDDRITLRYAPNSDQSSRPPTSQQPTTSESSTDQSTTSKPTTSKPTSDTSSTSTPPTESTTSKPSSPKTTSTPRRSSPPPKTKKTKTPKPGKTKKPGAD